MPGGWLVELWFAIRIDVAIRNRALCWGDGAVVRTQLQQRRSIGHRRKDHGRNSESRAFEGFLAGEVGAVGGEKQVQGCSGGHPPTLSSTKEEPGHKRHVQETYSPQGSSVFAEAEVPCRFQWSDSQ